MNAMKVRTLPLAAIAVGLLLVVGCDRPGKIPLPTAVADQTLRLAALPPAPIFEPPVIPPGVSCRNPSGGEAQVP